MRGSASSKDAAQTLRLGYASSPLHFYRCSQRQLRAGDRRVFFCLRDGSSLVCITGKEKHPYRAEMEKLGETVPM